MLRQWIADSEVVMITFAAACILIIGTVGPCLLVVYGVLRVIRFWLSRPVRAYNSKKRMAAADQPTAAPHGGEAAPAQEP